MGWTSPPSRQDSISKCTSSFRQRRAAPAVRGIGLSEHWTGRSSARSCRRSGRKPCRWSACAPRARVKGRSMPKPSKQPYSQDDWDEVSDNPELTEADFKRARARTRGLPGTRRSRRAPSRAAEIGVAEGADQPAHRPRRARRLPSRRCRVADTDELRAPGRTPCWRSRGGRAAEEVGARRGLGSDCPKTDGEARLTACTHRNAFVTKMRDVRR
jgi:hypothetical protein